MKILVSGASWTTGSASVRPKFNWATQMGEVLPAEVTNLAKDGMSPDYVRRSIMSKVESFEYDYVIAIFPSLFNRREIIMRDESVNNSLYQFVPVSGIPGNAMKGHHWRFISNKKIEILDDWQGHILNEYADYYNGLSNIIMLSQYLKLKNIKSIMMFDLPPYKFLPSIEVAADVNMNLTQLTALAKEYVSLDSQNTLFHYISHDLESYYNETEHPNDAGHAYIGDIMADRIRNL